MPPTTRWPLACFITFSTYGTHLHGDARGSVDVRHNLPGTPVLAPDPRRADAEASRLNYDPYTLGLVERRIVDRTLREVCEHRGWTLLAMNVRTNHVHVVISGQIEPSAMLAAMKAWATRRLTEAGCIPKGRTVWTSGGSKRQLWSQAAVEAAWDYVVHGQGPDLLDTPAR